MQALSAASGPQTTLVIVDANGLKMMLIKIVMTLGVDLGLKEAKQVVDNSGSFTTKLSAEQATDLIAACQTHGIILAIA
ncbi:ribosomal protein L7/L12 [Mollicutes bacterium LVI A0039]|nr:ribosomal protein L7/L12 [Mollicutes bacterium LVI A0039]